MSNYFTFLQSDEMQINPTGETIILKPSVDDLNDFSALGVSAFDFWNNKDDDIYDKFYRKEI